MNIDELIDRYLLAAAEHWQSLKALGHDASAVRRGNQAADDMRRIATDVGAAGATTMQAFGRLLDEPRNGVRAWAAFHVLGVMQAPPDLVDGRLTSLKTLPGATVCRPSAPVSDCGSFERNFDADLESERSVADQGHSAFKVFCGGSFLAPL
jgi:hypothetical protein